MCLKYNKTFRNDNHEDGASSSLGVLPRNEKNPDIAVAVQVEEESDCPMPDDSKDFGTSANTSSGSRDVTTTTTNSAAPFGGHATNMFADFEVDDNLLSTFNTNLTVRDVTVENDDAASDDSVDNTLKRLELILEKMEKFKQGSPGDDKEKETEC